MPTLIIKYLVLSALEHKQATLVATSSNDQNYILNIKPRLIKHTTNVESKIYVTEKINTIRNGFSLSPIVYVSSVINTPQMVINEVKQTLINKIKWDKTSLKICT